MKRREFISQTASALGAMSLAGLTTAFKKNEIPYRVLGKTGLKVSLLGLGGHHIGRSEVTDENSVAIIRGAIDMGVNFLDNAWEYNDGRSEELMGKALLNGYREKVYLMTKHHGREPETARKHLEESLTRLKTDYLDVWQFHMIDIMDDVNQIYSSGVLDFALKMKQQGKVRYIGFTGHTHPALHKEMIERGFDWDTVQMPLNMLDQQHLSFSTEIIPLLREKNMGIIGMKTVAAGNLIEEKVATIEECLNFAMSLPASTVVSGIASLDHLNQNVSIARGFKQMGKMEMADLMERTYEVAQEGTIEFYKRAEV